jgi:serine/threonine-protein phosphatase CPPED1
MNKKNKYLVFILLMAGAVVVIATIGPLFIPKDTNWNPAQLQKFDHNQKVFSFIVVGDSQDSITAFNSLIDKINKENVLFVVDNGDLVASGEQIEYTLFLEQIKRSNKPFLTTLGNHDLMRSGSSSNYQQIFGHPYYSFIIGDSYFIMLDSGSGKSLDPIQIEWLHNQLNKSLNYRYRFVFMHVPLFDPLGRPIMEGHSLGDINQAKMLNNLFDQYKITMLFSSHIHAYYNGTWGKTPYIITGGAGGPLEHPDQEHNFYNYVKVNVTQKGVNYQMIRLS